ncbi:MAG: hypothetical protein HC827_04100 [Cyanobacteria bacterium RM1_2_2]|nr:hypothetical protein [Cyanobacteria bacterium RM1_2_2]
MDANFADLELLAQQPLVFDTAALLSAAKPIYENASLHELFDLLESAIESYTLVQDHLAVALRESAEKEIEFFSLLLQERLNSLLEQPKSSKLPLKISSI